LLEEDRWVHVAWVWGVRHDLTVRGGAALRNQAQAGVLVNQLYIDGRRGRFTPDQIPGNAPALPPLRLSTGAAFDGAIDELRISDSIRYTNEFSPPPRDRELTVDEHTRALFHFNGDLSGESAAGGEPPQVTLD
jgi:hypothetical protein